jgi:hypothetical protein
MRINPARYRHLRKGRCSRLRLLLMAAIAMLVASAPAAASPWLDDYAALKAEMVARYANLAWFASPQGGVDLPQLDRRTMQALAGARNAEEARAALRNFIAALDDGHFSILPPPPSDSGPAEPEPPQADVAESDAALACAALGYANRSQIAFSLPFESLPGFALLATGEDSDFRAGLVELAGKRVGIVRIRNFSPSQYPTVCAAAWGNATPAQRADRDAFSQHVQDQWLASLAAVVAQVSARSPDLMLVDVGTNSGGNESGDWAARLFTRQPLRSARVLMRPGRSARSYLDDEIEALDAAIWATTDQASRQAGEQAMATLRARRQAAGGTTCALDWAWRERRPWAPFGCSGLIDAGFASGVVRYLPPATLSDAAIARRIYWPAAADPLIGRWSGPLYVLTNSATYSAAEMFTAVLQNNRAARIVGTPSGGDGCGFMAESEPLVLPNTQLRLRLPDCVRLRADGSNEVAGIQPDIAIQPRVDESPRARAMRLLRIIVAERPVEPR